MRFHWGSQWDKPFLHPIRTVSGKVLSRGYPVDRMEGEQTDHEWHRGIWYGHGIVNGHDFWRERGRDKTSRLITRERPAIEKTKFGPVLQAESSMVPPDGKPIGTVSQIYSFRDEGPLRLLSATIKVAADAGTALTFGDTDDGGFAIRLRDAFREDRGARLRNSNGLEGTKNIWGQAARWVDYSAVIGGTPAGVAIFDHFTNLRHPTEWHARGYGLNAANPFASRSFHKGSQRDGTYTVAAGAILVLHYLVVIHEGPFEPAAIEARYRAWTKSSGA